MVCKTEDLICFNVMLRFFVGNLGGCFIGSVLKIFVKATAKSFLDRLIRRENIVLSEWCSFSSATYATGFCYVVIDFLRRNLIVRSGEENL